MVKLRGMTWDHPRAAESVEAATRAYMSANPDVSVEWDRRSLQSFESEPLEEMARDYDFIIIDHPHLGAVMRSGCLQPIGQPENDERIRAIASDFIGQSFESYVMDGALWALPIDGAAMMQCIRADSSLAPARTWREVIERARSGGVVWALRPPHPACSFFTLAANTGHATGYGPEDFTPMAPGVNMLEAMKAVSDHVDPACYEMDAIACLDALSEDARFITSPLVFGYVNYALDGFRARRVRFMDMPALGADGPVGSMLGGAGFAITSATRHPDAAADFGFHLASGPVQAGIYGEAGGQPAHIAAWEDGAANSATLDFYRGARRTLDSAWLRPRHAGYTEFQHLAGVLINRFLTGAADARATMKELSAAYADSFR